MCTVRRAESSPAQNFERQGNSKMVSTCVSLSLQPRKRNNQNDPDWVPAWELAEQIGCTTHTVIQRAKRAGIAILPGHRGRLGDVTMIDGSAPIKPLLGWAANA